jgi:hypothetical protein
VVLARHFVRCRCSGKVALELPCNWVKDGFCGVDARQCKIERVS